MIVHTGQTGVERGACQAARAVGLPTLGVMPSDGRDERGRIPPDVSADLVVGLERGHRAAVRSCVELATSVLVVIPVAAAPSRFTAMSVVTGAAGRAGRSWFIADLVTDVDDIAAWVARQPTPDGAPRLFVTGPRGTRWTSGEAVARRIVTGLAMALGAGRLNAARG